MFGWILLLLLALVLLISYIDYRIAFYSPKGNQNDDYAVGHSTQMEPLRETVLGMIRSLNERPFERVWITSFDGLQLAGRYYHQADGAPLDICFHGYRGTPSRDFSGGTAIYFGQGHNVLMIEQRGQCGSEGHTITFGVLEQIDCMAWVQYAVDRFGPDVKILLDGISMGAATVLMASGADLPENVRGIVADCPYTTPGAIIRKVCRDMHLPPRLSWPFLYLGALLFGHFHLNQGDAAEAVKHSQVPILLIHGEEDHFVPCDMSRAIAAANPEKVTLHTFPGAGHGLSYLIDGERYTALVKEFSEKVLNS